MLRAFRSSVLQMVLIALVISQTTFPVNGESLRKIDKKLESAKELNKKLTKVVFPNEFSIGTYFILDGSRDVVNTRYRDSKSQGQLMGSIRLFQDCKICVDLKFRGGERLELLKLLPEGSLVGVDISILEITDRMLEKLAGRTELQYLNAAESDITGKSLQTIAKFPNLRALKLDFTYMRNADLLPLSSLVKLQSLSFFNCGLAKGAVRNFTTMTQLEHLDLHRCQISNDDLVYIGQLTNLKRLIIGSNLITDEGLTHLAKLTNLELLEIDGNDITYKGLQSLAKLRKLARLKVDIKLSSVQAQALNKSFAKMRFSPWKKPHRNEKTLLEELF